LRDEGECAFLLQVNLVFKVCVPEKSLLISLVCHYHPQTTAVSLSHTHTHTGLQMCAVFLFPQPCRLLFFVGFGRK